MSGLFRVSESRPMGPITGIRPTDEHWGGEMPEEYVEAIFNDVNDDLEYMVE